MLLGGLVPAKADTIDHCGRGHQEANCSVLAENSLRANYGVKCVKCGKADYMKYLRTEQVGMNGSMFISYYQCTKCNVITTVTLYA